MKRPVYLFAIIIIALSACKGDLPSSGAANPAGSHESGKPVELTVMTSYGREDGNRANYEKYFKAYETATGNIIRDASGISNEEWKTRVIADFETGAEPDILFFFTGSAANPLIESGKFVSVDEIRAVYPDYASNMKDSMLPKSPADGKQYAIPVTGYWEGLFVNKNVLADCGVEIPGPDTTWEQFMEDCEIIAANGYTPIAASLYEVPHYWFEFCIFNHTAVDIHTKLPVSSGDETGAAWAAGLNDIKDMYERGFFPANTTTATDPETNMLMINNRAAFMIDGSWKVGWFVNNAADINDFTVTYVPAKGNRKPTEMIGGLSMGYYITRKAWDNPEKQAACAEFIMTMTTDEVISAFGATVLESGVAPPEDASSLVRDAIVMTKGTTGVVPAVQDGLIHSARGKLFGNIKNIVTGSMTAEQAIDQALGIAG